MTEKSPIPMTHPPEAILLYDGVCHMCHSSVQFVLRHNDNEDVYFASLQSEMAQKLLATHGYSTVELQSVVFIEDDRLYTKSDAALRVGKKLNGGWRTLSLIGLAVPRFIRDPIYTWIARNRYRWFGKSEQCLLPTPEVRARFLD
ncbi:thiol-disulfide oxidoreductase DCC family protein [Brevibacillus sp. AY1]|uniref:thiol-disulfide oxidoreductase DCC family protein n=1 Tax=Brevibacillus sp. AY1 TaxID=2807621 RepID=UPI0024551F93|nr:thiol-disulfide oxidoreductase DCC family protein [Brevibacillus sp. AY1]